MTPFMLDKVMILPGAVRATIGSLADKGTTNYMEVRGMMSFSADKGMIF